MSKIKDENEETSFQNFFNNLELDEKPSDDPKTNPDIDISKNSKGFIYKVDLKANLIDNSIDTDTQGNITFETAGFNVPEEIINPSNDPSINPLNSLRSLEKFVGRDIAFPLYQVYSGDNISNGLLVNGGKLGVNFELRDSTKTVPEANTSVGLLTLGLLGVGSIFRRKHQNNL